MRGASGPRPCEALRATVTSLHRALQIFHASDARGDGVRTRRDARAGAREATARQARTACAYHAAHRIPCMRAARHA
ncbi:hypothetical protein BMD20_25910 [Burkholderia multivorans]|nr:hypothetical protein BMD20_25910 [Burkholderia multivorans]KHS15152.1 hypothetical protein BMD22_20755 [Burkholderia multivorans]